MSEPEPEKKRKTIKHQMSVMRNHPMKWLTKFSLLVGYTPHLDHTDLEKMYNLQRALRWQYYRMIDERKDSRQKLTYNLNCRPSGFTVTPWSLTCGNCRVCPWCFVRRLYTGYELLMPKDAKTRNLHSIVAWKRGVGLDDKLPFFRSHYGPQVWFKMA
jgi:hypothetical protein